MRIWRVEHSVDRYGPYCSGKGRDDLTMAIADAHSYYQNRLTHPTTGYDGFWEMENIPASYRHGLNSFLAARTWFLGWVDRLRLNGFTLSVYDAPVGHYWIGNSRTQVVFDPEHSTLLREKDFWRE